MSKGKKLLPHSHDSRVVVVVAMIHYYFILFAFIINWQRALRAYVTCGEHTCAIQ